LHIKTAWEENDGWPSTKDEPKQKEVIAGLMKELESVYSIKFPRTKTGEYCLDENVLGMLDDDVSESSFLKPFKEYKHAEKILSTYLNKDCVGGDGRVHPRISYIMLTGRTSYSRPNLQNVPKERGIREMYCAAPGWVLVSIDYDQIELCSLAQACFVKYGKSRMKDIINAGIDVHGWFACILEGKLTREQIEIDPENHAVIQSIIELIKDMKENNKDFKRSRALSKVCDFGQEVLDIAC
jgi:DNA polymerase I-like protein with 3'-5' exonuclease and polymerase domains